MDMMTLGCVKFLFIGVYQENDNKLKRRLDEFQKWMGGQTGALIEGHFFYYLCDVQRFMANKPVID